MPFEPFTRLRSRTIVLPNANIDTDQIIPGRYLTTTTREGLGAAAFHDWRFDAAGAPVADHPLNMADPSAHRVLVGGANFGCGSSREHAPWALFDFGFRAVVSSDIADIFKSNALKNGLLPVEVGADAHAFLLATPGGEVEIDLEAQTIRVADDWWEPFEVETFARRCLLDGVDPLGHILNQAAQIEAFEKEHA